MKAVPVLILEKWVQEGREEGRANYVRTSEIARRLVNSRLVDGFKAKGTSTVLGGLSLKQSAHNLTRPPLITYNKVWKNFEVNLPHYEQLLQEYRQVYRELYSEDYEKLFSEGEPDWEPSLVELPVEGKEARPILPKPQKREEMHSLLAPLNQALREREQTIRRLTEENQKLQAELATLQAPGRRIVDEELRNDCAEFLKRENTYIDAVRRAGVVLEERFIKTIGGGGPERIKHGVQLVEYALSPHSGRLVFSEHPGEQAGYEMLFKSAFAVLRNPPMHRKVQYTEQEVRRAIGLIDYLLSLLGEARPRE